MVAKACRAMIRREAGEPKAALADARDASLATIASSFSHTPLEFGEAVECALAADAPDVIAQLLERIDELQPVQLIPLLDAEATRARAHLAVARGDTTAAAQWFRRSIDLFRELSTPFYLARAQLQYAELLATPTRDMRRATKPRRRSRLSAPLPGWHAHVAGSEAVA